jgi:hypothetical protein
MRNSEDLRDQRVSLPGVVADCPDGAGLPPRPMRPESAAAYIADITNELASLARGCKLEILAYLLDIAQLEAANAARRLARKSCAG